MTERDKVAKDFEANFKQWQEVGESIKKIVATALKQQELIQEALRKAFQPIIENKEAIRKAGEFIIPALEQLKKSFQELPPRTQEALILLGKHGWYFDFERPITALWELKKEIKKGNIKEAEDTLIEYFENKLDEIEESIIKRFPHRDKIIRTAFKAHRRKEYELSIPVFLSQTDGICKEVINEHLFRRKSNNKPRTSNYVELMATDPLRAAFLSPLSQILPIAASERERDENFTELNRHMVLHGDSLDYGTKINSLKAISLLGYVAQVLKEY